MHTQPPSPPSPSNPLGSLPQGASPQGASSQGALPQGTSSQAPGGQGPAWPATPQVPAPQVPAVPQFGAPAGQEAAPPAPAFPVVAPTQPSRPATPTSARERSLAPDLARGVMLLAIVVANTPLYLWASDWGDQMVAPKIESIGDAITQAFLLIVVDQRIYPMFSFLVGYGMVMLHRRQWERGNAAGAMRILVRRNLMLILVGFLHALLLFGGDIVGLYGLLSLLIAALFINASDRTLKIWTWVTFGWTTLMVVVASLGTALANRFMQDVPAAQAGATAGMDMGMGFGAGQSDYFPAMLERLMMWLLQVPVMLLLPTVPLAMMIGMLAARRRWLDRPADHRVLLRRVALFGISVGWVAGAVDAAARLGAFGDGAGVMDGVLAAPSTLAGVACGVGYAALFGLVALRLTGGTGFSRDAAQHGVLVEATAAVGKRSLSCYLAQSVVCAPVLSAWGLGVGAYLTSWSMALFAVGTWVVIAVGALALERAGKQGPAEWLVRKAAYRR